MGFEVFSMLRGFVFDLQRFGGAVAIEIREGATGLPAEGETTYYYANGVVVSNDDIAAGNYAVSVTHNNTGSYTVNVLSKPSAGIVIYGKSVDVSGTAASDTEFKIGNNATFTSVSSFHVSAKNVISEIGTGDTVVVKSGIVETSQGTGRFDMSEATWAGVWFMPGPELNGVEVSGTKTGRVTLNGSVHENDAHGSVYKSGEVENLSVGTAVFTDAPTGSRLKINCANYQLAGEATGAEFRSVGGTGYTYLTAGTVLLNGSGCFDDKNMIKVMDAGETYSRSMITTGKSDSKAQVVVKDGTYTLSNLADGEVITIDGVAYTYDEDTWTLLTTEGEKKGFVLKNSLVSGSATFNIAGNNTWTSSDTIDSNSGSAYVYEAIGSLGDGLEVLTRKISSATTIIWFDVDGNQLPSSDSAAYTLTKATDENNKVTYELKSTELAGWTNNFMTIDASGVTGLKVDLSLHEENDLSPALYVDYGIDPVTVAGGIVHTNTGDIEMRTGTVDVTAAGVISNISGNAYFITKDLSNSMSFKVTKTDDTVTGAIVDNYIYEFTSGKTLKNVTINMGNNAADKITNMEVSKGFDFTAESGVQYLDLGDSDTDTPVNSSVLPKNDPDILLDGHKYLKYDATNKKLGVVDSNGNQSEYDALITIDASTYTGTTLALQSYRFSVDLTIGNVTVTGVDNNDTINGVSMAHAGDSDLTVVGKVEGNNKSVASISGLAANNHFGIETNIPAGVIVNTATGEGTGTFSVNNKFYVLDSTAVNTIKTTNGGSCLCVGTATLATGGGETSITIGNTTGTATTTLGAFMHADETSDTTVTVTVTDNIGFEISNLADGDVVSIGNAEFTYSSEKSALLDRNNHGYLIDDTDIAFKLSTDGTKYELDTTNNQAAVYAGSLTEDGGLKKITDAITGSSGTLYFDAKGNQVLTRDAAYYSVAKATDGGVVTYTLASENSAASPLTIDASQVSGLITLSSGTFEIAAANDNGILISGKGSVTGNNIVGLTIDAANGTISGLTDTSVVTIKDTAGETVAVIDNDSVADTLRVNGVTYTKDGAVAADLKAATIALADGTFPA